MKRSGPPRRNKPLKARKGLSSKPKAEPTPRTAKLPPLPKVRAKTRIPVAGDPRRHSFRFVTLGKNRGRCVVPKCRREATDPHHVVYRRHIPDRFDDMDARDGLPLCHQHHWMHHYGGFNGKLPASCLLPENLEFAREVLGERAESYIRRHYATDEEFAAKLARARPER